MVHQLPSLAQGSTLVKARVRVFWSGCVRPLDSTEEVTSEEDQSQNPLPEVPVSAAAASAQTFLVNSRTLNTQPSPISAPVTALLSSLTPNAQPVPASQPSFNPLQPNIDASSGPHSWQAPNLNPHGQPQRLRAVMVAPTDSRMWINTGSVLPELRSNGVYVIKLDVVPVVQMQSQFAGFIGIEFYFLDAHDLVTCEFQSFPFNVFPPQSRAQFHPHEARVSIHQLQVPCSQPPPECQSLTVFIVVKIISTRGNLELVLNLATPIVATGVGFDSNVSVAPVIQHFFALKGADFVFAPHAV